MLLRLHIDLVDYLRGSIKGVPVTRQGVQSSNLFSEDCSDSGCSRPGDDDDVKAVIVTRISSVDSVGLYICAVDVDEKEHHRQVQYIAKNST